MNNHRPEIVQAAIDAVNKKMTDRYDAPHAWNIVADYIDKLEKPAVETLDRGFVTRTLEQIAAEPLYSRRKLEKDLAQRDSIIAELVEAIENFLNKGWGISDSPVVFCRYIPPMENALTRARALIQTQTKGE